MTDTVATKSGADATLQGSGSSSPGGGKKRGKWRRWLLVLVILVVGFWVGHLMLDGYLRERIRLGAETSVFQKTTLGSARIQFGRGRLVLRDLRVANPSGFSDAEFLRMDQCVLEIQATSLLREPVAIPEIEIDGLKVVMEQHMVLNNVQEILSKIHEEHLAHGTEASRRLVVGTVRIRQAVLVLRSQSLPGVKSKVSTVELPEMVIDFAKVGKAGAEGAGGGVITMRELTLQILGRVAQEAGGSKQVDAGWRMLLRPIASTLQAPTSEPGIR